MVERKTEQDDIPAQVRLVENQLGKVFKVAPEHQRMYQRLLNGYSNGAEFAGVTASWGREVLDLKAEYPKQYDEFLCELRRIRLLQANAISEFLNCATEQQYPIFIPTWLKGKKAYEEGRNNNTWLNNSDQNYFDQHQFSVQSFPEISANARIFYSHCTIGPGIASFARLFPNTDITAGDINPMVCRKCSDYLTKDGIANVSKFVDAPAEYLTGLADSSFEVVFTHGAIWNNPFKAFTQYCRVLQPGGLLIGSIPSSVKSHDTIHFFEQYSRIYNLEPSLQDDGKFLVVTIKLSKEAKAQVACDMAVVELLSRKICPESEDAAELPKYFGSHHGFPIYEVNKEDMLQNLEALGYTRDEIRESLKRLSKIAKGDKAVTEASYNAIAVSAV